MNYTLHQTYKLCLTFLLTLYKQDSKGLIVKSRTELKGTEKAAFWQDVPHIKDFEEMIKTIKPTAILGNHIISIANLFSWSMFTLIKQIITL